MVCYFTKSESVAMLVIVISKCVKISSVNETKL